MCWPAAHRERRARFLYRKPGRKGMVDGSLGRRKIPALRGGGGRARSALKERARGLWPRVRSFVWQAEGRPAGPPLGRQTPPPPGGTPALPPTSKRQGKSPALRLVQPHPVHRWGKRIFMQIALCFPANSRIVEDRKICFVCNPIWFPPIKEAFPWKSMKNAHESFLGRVFRPYGRHCPWPCSMWWP